MSAREIKKTQLSKSKSKSRVGCTVSNRGLTLIELLVTMSIATIILVAVGDLGTMTLRTSMLAKAQSTTVDLKETLSSALESGSDSCKGNLAPVKAGPPPFGELSGANQNKGVGQIDILRRYAGTTKGAVLVKKGEAFKGDLDIVAMRLIDPLETTGPPAVLINDPKTAPPKTREFYVFFKMRGVGPLGTKGPDCKEASTLTKLKSDCYSVKCTVMKYRLNSQTVTSHADFNKVDECGEVNCIALSKGFSGGSVKNKKCADKGQYLDGFDSAGTEICEPSGGPKFNVFLGKEAGKATTGSTNTFIGHQAGYLNTTGGANVFIGNHAGFFYHGTKANQKGNIAGSYSVIIGNYAGRKNNASSNTFIGAAAGEENISGIQNTIIGAWAGQKLTASNNVFIGNGAGGKTNNGNENVIIGSYAGFENTTGDYNVFIGRHAGNKNITGGENVFIGKEAGKANTSSLNTFVGYQAGLVNTTAPKNTFIGAETGKANTKGRWNTFVGYKAGLNTDMVDPTSSTEAMQNVFIGKQTGELTTSGGSNTFIGTLAGYANTLGSYNIFIGRGVAGSSTTEHGGVSKTASNQLNIGNLIFGKLPTSAPPATPSFFSGRYTPTGGLSERVVINGDLLVKGDVYKKCGTGTTCDSTVAIPISSSKVFKKNIVPFTDYNKSLQDILRTPLFNYQYKKDHPDKTRMGVIAEDLPENLQLKDNPISPDWPTIWGTLWAGIKEVYARLQQFKAEVLKALKGIRASLTQTQDRLEILEKKIKALENENKKLKEHNQLLQKQIKINQQAIGA